MADETPIVAKPAEPQAPRPGIAAKTNILKPTQSTVKEAPKEVLEQTFKIEDPKILDLHDPQRLTDETGKPLKKVEDVDTRSQEDIDEEKRAREVLFNKKSKEEPKEEKKEEPKKEEDKKVSQFIKPPSKDKKEEKKEAPKGEEEHKEKLIVPPNKARDVSGFTEKEATLLRQMSGEAFDYTKEVINENKKLKETAIFQHPQAYVLDPVYQQTQTEISFAQRAADHWERQLLLIDEGKPFHGIEGLNPDGSFKLTAEVQPNKKMEETVRRNMNNCLAEATARRNKLEEFPQQYQQRVNQDLNAVQQERAKRFAWAADPQYLDYTLDMGEFGEQSIKQIRQNFVDLFPPYMRNHPACEVAADMFVALRIQDMELKQATSGKQVADTKLEEAKRAEPTSQTKPAPPSDEKSVNGSPKVFNLEGMPK